MCSALSQTALGSNGVFVSEIDDGVGAVDAFERESGGEFVEREELAIVLGRPAQQAEKVDESLGQEAGIAIGGDADDRAVAALGELGAIGRDQQGKMGELRRLDAQALEDQQMLEGVGEVILAADDVADAQIGVVDAGGEVVRRHAVRAQQREVFDLVGELGLRAVDAVGEAQRAVLAAGDAIAERERLATGGAAVAGFSSISSRMPGLKSHAPCAEDWSSSPECAGVKSR